MIVKIWFGWFTLETVVCGVVGSDVDMLLVLFQTICIKEKLGEDILGLVLIGVVLVLVCGTVSELLLDTCEHLVLRIGCSGPSINCLIKFSGSLTVLELFCGVITTVL